MAKKYLLPTFLARFLRRDGFLGLFLGLLLGREEARARPLGSLQAPPRGDPTPYGWGWKAPPIWGGTGTGKGFSSPVVMVFFGKKERFLGYFGPFGGCSPSLGPRKVHPRCGPRPYAWGTRLPPTWTGTGTGTCQKKIFCVEKGGKISVFVVVWTVWRLFCCPGIV